MKTPSSHAKRGSGRNLRDAPQAAGHTSMNFVGRERDLKKKKKNLVDMMCCCLVIELYGRLQRKCIHVYTTAKHEMI